MKVPNRILREGILTSPRVKRLEGWASEVFYRRLMSVVDDFGRYHADYGLLRAACYPRQLNKVSDADIGKWLADCESAALVSMYPASDGERYLQLLDFRQQARAAKSKFPEPLRECAANATQVMNYGAAPAPVFGDEGVSEGVEPTVLAALPAAKRPPDCPTEALIALYHEHLPMLPRVEVVNDSRKRALSARWREVVTDADIRKANDQRAAGLDWFAWFFGHAARSKFLTGKAKDWRADFDFLLTPSKFAKVVEGSYHKDTA